MKDRNYKPAGYIIIGVLAYLNAVSMQYVSAISGDPGTYIGTQIYSFMPESILWFGVCFFFLHRFAKEKVWKQKGRLILSLILGFILGFTSVWGQEVLYNTTLFTDPRRLLYAFAAATGLMFFMTPFVSWLIGLCDGVSEKVSAKPAETQKLRPVFYFLILWAVIFVTYIPMFLYTYPCNLFGDAADALGYDYLLGRRSVHHTPIHWLLLGWFYDLGLRHGSPAFGIQFFTLMQMLILSGAIAFLSAYLYKKKTNRWLRIAVSVLSLINPVNGYFAVTAEKGTIGIALALIGIVILCMINEDPGEKRGFSGFSWPYLAKLLLFTVIMSVACLFRNNMIYALIAGGIVVAVLAKGLKKKAALLAMFILTFVLYKAEFDGLVRWQGLINDDQYRETFALPIMCLSRIAVLHGGELPEGMYGDIVSFIPEAAMEGYSISSADSVKGDASEGMLKAHTGKFLGLFVKGALLYPGDYLDQFAWLTYGYWNPLYNFVLASTAPAFHGALPDGLEPIEEDNYLPIGGKFMDWMYYDGNGRFMIPVIAWFFRPVIYTYAALFAFCYGIYRKDRKKIALSIIPLLYLGTILLGPLCQFRYVYLNVLFLGFTLFVTLTSFSSETE